MKSYEQRGHRPEPSRGGVKIPGPHPVAAMEWLSPPKPSRDQDALCETTGPEPHGARLRPAGRGDPNPHRRAKPLHSSWHPCHRTRRISPSGERGRTHFTPFVQQSPLYQQILGTFSTRNIGFIPCWSAAPARPGLGWVVWVSVLCWARGLSRIF